MNKINTYENVLLAFQATKPAIFYALQFAQAAIEKEIKPEHFGHKEALAGHFKQIDWTNNTTAFSHQADNAAHAIVGFWILICYEAYFDLIEGEPVEYANNPDLHSAQMILKLLRHAMAHPKVTSDGYVRTMWNIQQPSKRREGYNKLYEVKKINVILDARNLNGTDFKMAHLGGWDNFFKLLTYFEQHLEENISQLKKNLN